MHAFNHTMIVSNPRLRKALTWATVTTALVSALLLAATGAGLPTANEAKGPGAGLDAANVESQAQVGNGQRTPSRASATRAH